MRQAAQGVEVRGLMGKPMHGWNVDLLDEDEVGKGERGEICLRATSPSSTRR